MSTNTIEYRIRAAVENLGEIGKLVGELDELGVSTDEVKGEVSRLAAELDQLGTRGRAGEALTELVRDAQGSADASRQAAAAVKPLALAYRQAQQAAQQAGAAQAAAAAQVATLSQQLQQARAAAAAESAALDAARAQVRAIATDIRAAGGANAALTESYFAAEAAVKAAAQRYAEAQSAVKSASAAFSEGRSAARELAKAVEEANANVASTGRAFEQARNAARDMAAQYEASRLAVQRARAEYTAAGGDATRLAAAQAATRSAIEAQRGAITRLVGSLGEMRAAQQQAIAAERTAAEAAKVAAAARARADAEAARLAQYNAMVEVRAQQQIADARRRGAAAAEQAARTVRSSTQQTASSAGLLRDALALAGGAGIAREFVQANVRAQTLDRTLKQLTGSAQAAAREQEYLRKTANNLGVAVADVSGAYINLLAAAKGTALEGQGVREVFESIVGALSGLGKSGAEIDQALGAIVQMITLTKVQSEELKEQLGTALPGSLQIAADALHVTTGQLIQMMESGKLITNDFLPLFARQVRTHFGSSKEPVQGLAADMARLRNEYELTLQKLGEAGGNEATTTLMRGVASATSVAGAAVVFLGKSLGNLTANLTNNQRYMEEQRNLAADLGKVWRAATGAVDDQKKEQDDLAKGIEVGTQATLAAAVAAARAREEDKRYATDLSVLRTQLGLANTEYEHHRAALDRINEVSDAHVAATTALAEATGDEATQQLAAVGAALQRVVALSNVKSAQEGTLVVAQRDLELAQQLIGAKDKVTQADVLQIAELQTKVQVAQAEVDATGYQIAAAEALLKQRQREASVRRQALTDAERETTTTQAVASAKVAEAQASLDIARAKGDEVAERRATIALAKAEANLASVVATGKRNEARAAQEAADKFRSESKARGDNSAAAQEEQARLDAAATQKQADADAASATANAKEAEAKARARNIEQIEREQQLQGGGGKPPGQKDAEDTTKAVIVATNAFADFTAEITSYGVEAAKLFDANLHAAGLRELSAGLGGVAAQAARSTDDLAGMRAELQKLAAETHAGGANETDSNLAAWGRAANATKRAILEARIEVAELEQKLNSGTASAGDLARATSVARERAKLLGSERLQSLNDAIARAREQVQGLRDDLSSALASAQSELAQLQGNAAEVERLRYEQQTAELRRKTAEAQASGDRQAIADASALAQVYEQIHQAKREQARQEAEQQRQQAAEAGRQQQSATATTTRSTGAPTTAAAAPRVLGVYELKLNVGGQPRTLRTLDNPVDVLGQIERDALRSAR